MRLAGKVALVTGAGRGIGREIALAFSREGARVVAVDRDEQTVAQTVADIVAAGAQALAVRADVGKPPDVERAMHSTLDAFGQLDILVSNAGVGFHRAILDLELADWNRVLQVNLTGTFLMVQAAGKAMSPRKSGSIIVMGSTSGQRGAMARVAYGVSKAGVMQLVKVAAVEFAPLGIRVNALAPGPIVTPLSMGNHTAAQKSAYLERIPLGRYGECAEVAAAAVFLASDDASYVNGHTLNVDGGMNAAGLMFSHAEMRRYALRQAGDDPQ